MFGALALFVVASALIAAAWNRWLAPRVSWRIVAVLWLFCAVYQAETLFTTRVDLRGVAHNVSPWTSLELEPVHANTGIVFTQLAPWTRNARDQLLRGEMPLWNRTSASGAPLLANQQTAIFHPFTLLGFPLSVGKAFTLSATLRIFAVLFFTFVFLRGWGIRDQAALFGGVAYAFCTFHVVWLLFPLGLATMMLPIALAGAQRIETRAGYVVLVIGLSAAVLGGHPESALWVWIATVAFILYQRKRIVFAATAFIVAMLLTAFFWYPTLDALPSTSRFRNFQTPEANPADHGLSYEWLFPLVAPNVFGNPHDASYTPPRGTHGAVLNDYGEVASSYAGLLTLALALAAPFVARRKPLGFAIGLMLFSLLTIAEVPLWRDAIRAIPLAGISLHQRLRIFWDLGVCIAAALTVDVLWSGGRQPAEDERRAKARRFAMLVVSAAFLCLYALRHPPFTPLAIAQLIVPLATLVFFAVRPTARVAVALVFVDLVVATWRYNPPARAHEVYPVTGAIRLMQSAPKPSRIAAWGWSLIPDTPGWYGLEDIKTTDPVQHFAYMFLLHGYLDVEPGSYDLVLRNVERPYFDFLNVRYLYVPPEHDIRAAGFVERYRGRDGVVLENVEALPRYFFARTAHVESDLGTTIYKSRAIRDFRSETYIDHSPFTHFPEQFAGGSVRVVAYEANRTVLDLDSKGLNLLVTSDVNWPGWRAWWNGERKSIVRVNGAFVGVFVPEGRGRLELRYRPQEFVRGLWAGVAGLMLFAVMTIAAGTAVPSRARHAGETSTTEARRDAEASP